MRMVGFGGLALSLVLPMTAVGALQIQANRDVPAGRAAFLASGVATVEFDWQSAAGSTYQLGQIGTLHHLPSVSVGTNVIRGGSFGPSCTNTNPTPISLANWVDGPGFNSPNSTAIADLAINDIESFEIEFGQPHRSVGFAIITGTGNLPDEVDLTGAAFQFAALDSNATVIGSATFTLLSGQVDQAWLTITSDLPFSKLVVCETDAPSVSDQYFSNILTSEQLVPPIPTVSEWGLIVMSLLILTAGTVVFTTRRTVRATGA